MLDDIASSCKGNNILSSPMEMARESRSDDRDS
jgi:hypothetical protein